MCLKPTGPANAKPGRVKIKRLTPLLLCCLLLCFMTRTAAQDATIKTAGDILLVAMPASALGGTLIIGDTRGTWQFSKGFVLNQLLTLGLKTAIDKPRPYDNGHYAFPSGHTSTTFQSAAFIQRRYGWKLGVPAYVLAGFTGYSRIEAQRHDGWDVFAGALIGIGSSYLFTTPYQREHMEVSFTTTKGYRALGFTYKF
jgi:membrane-associated phospholipid phosphatase